ncbi:MAG: DUF4157 domain-containing protein [Myxococcales bacterium]|nr:DUF4157 domain-containing protein [Myxococcota bacterium]MDW8281037.1 DUF4157 domain-containing protein [Myxococcales bacterium]
MSNQEVVQAKTTGVQDPFASRAVQAQSAEGPLAEQATQDPLAAPSAPLTGAAPSAGEAAPLMFHWAEEAPVQQRAQAGTVAQVHEAAAQGLSGTGEPLPFADQIQRSFGHHDVSGIRAHMDGPAQQAARQMGASAFASGERVAFAGSPDLHTAAHEAAHIVQQRGGVQLQDGVGRPGDVYEQHADAVADRVVRGESAVDLLDKMAGQPGHAQGVQGKALQHRGRKEVSGKAMKRLNAAKAAIDHGKSVFSFGAGNQAEALRATQFNSYFRLKVMRDMRYWRLADSVRPIAAANPEALTAAMADLAHGGNCGEHAQVAYDYLRVTAPGERINLADVEGLDHAFVLIGDVKGEADNEIAVSDPWPTAATATLWEDHFAFTPDRKKINVRSSMVADGKNVKAVIAAGLQLTEEGKRVCEMKLSPEETEKIINRDVGDWIWQHRDAAAQGKKYEYYTR